MPTAPSAPHIISGTVTLNASNYQGAKLWLWGITQGARAIPRDDITYVYTNSGGKYLINLTDTSATFSAGDKVRVYCKVAEMLSWSDITIEKKKSETTVNFTFTRKSRLVDGVNTGLSSGKGGLYKETIKGCKDGMQ